MKQWRNKKRKSEYDKVYNKLHRRQKSLNSKKWRVLHPDKFKEQHDKWYKKKFATNREYFIHQARVRRIRELGANGNHTLGEWENLKAQYNFKCPSCLKSEPEIRLTEDHIIPLSKGGSHNIENIQPLCRRCNARKQARLFVTYPNFSP
jgi:5-methylcytosine-specific restriction endonuclease McrA